MTPDREKIEAALKAVLKWFASIEHDPDSGKPHEHMDGEQVMYEHGESIREALEAQMAGGWRLKQGMPMDEGVSFLVLWENDDNAMVAVQVSWFQGDLYPDSLGSEADYDDRINLAHITHWQPLPELPQEG